MNKISKFFFHLFHTNWPLFIHLNFFSKKVIRHGAFLIPRWKSCIRIAKGATITVNKKNVFVGVSQRPHENKYAYITLKKNAQLIFKNGANIQRGCIVGLNENAIFETGFLMLNEDCLISCFLHISFGDFIVFSRNISIYDNDGHYIYENSQITNPPKPIVFGDNIWVTRGVCVSKGVHVGSNTVLASFAVITKDVPANSVCGSKFELKVIKEGVTWSLRKDIPNPVE
jgi:maltose O-acetyltransferase